MNYSDTLEESSEYLRLALDHMGRHQIPVDPENYSVWYEYVSGKNNRLKEAINGVLTKSSSITPELNRNLYERYIADNQTRILKRIRAELFRILEKILSHVSNTGGQFAYFENILSSYANKLKADNDIETVQNIVDGILSETETMIQSGENLQKRLASTTQEVELLRKNLNTIKEQASTDPLTGLKNRRYFSTAFKEKAKESTEKDQSLCLIIADIDHFKQINDSYGHLVGDKVLKLSADMIKDCIKGKDLIARYGGDEFVIILPDTPLGGAIALAENICSYFKTKNWRRKDTGEFLGNIHMSLGVAQFRPGESLESLLERSDRALYRSKSSGRAKATCEMQETKMATN